MKAVFILGPSRSGTSVLAQALGRHSAILTTEELHYYNLIHPKSEAVGDGETGALARLKAVQHKGLFFEVKNGTLTTLPEVRCEELPSGEQTLLQAFFTQLAQEAEAEVVVEHTPMNLYFMDQIRADFPQVLFVIMRRDPRAILASQKMRWKVGGNGTRNIPARDIARVRHAGHPILQLLLLRKTLRVMNEAQRAPDVVSVAYEDLVTEPRIVLADLVKRLGLNDDPAMCDVSDSGSSHATEGQRSGFDPARLESWRRSLTQTEIWMTEKLYSDSLIMPASGVRPRLSEVIWLVLRLPWATFMALYYSTRGYGRLLDAVKRRFL